MQSHCYRIQAKEAGQLILGPLGTVLGLAALLHAAVALGWLPSSRPTRDADQTILVHQADASRTLHDASVVLLGDSSCLMDVQAGLLTKTLGKSCLNLGTFSYLDLEAAAWLLEEYCRANRGQPEWAIVLLHPEALRRASPEAFPMKFLQHYLAGQPPPAQSGLAAQIQTLLGLNALQDRLLARWVPSPLSGSFGRYYGFSANLEQYLTRHHGSALDPEARPFRGNAEYNLAPSLERACRQFRQSTPSLPGRTRLTIGITPIPESYAPPGYRARYAAMLAQWGTWIEADAVLQGLPPTLPDMLFAKTTHLNEAGRRWFTMRLGEVLQESTRD